MAEPSVADVSAWESIAIAAARRAAVLIRSSVGRAVGVGLKSSPTDVVTQTDVDAELLIRRMLLEATPSAGLIGEEGEPTSPAAELQWIVDPLDGTVNFTYAVPIFAVSIAAAYSGSIVAAAVVDVMRDEVFSAGLGTGSRLDGESIRTSECATLPTAMVATGFSYRAGLRVEQGEVVRHLLPIVRDIRCFGSAALELCWLACGRVDVYYERDTKLWDYAAGSLIATEAGATIEMPCPENEGLIIGSPPALFAEMRALVDQVPV